MNIHIKSIWGATVWFGLVRVLCVSGDPLGEMMAGEGGRERREKQRCAGEQERGRRGY